MILSQSMINAIGFSLIHSFWQIAIIAFSLFIINRIFARKKSKLRYLTSFTALIFVLFSFLVTFTIIRKQSLDYTTTVVKANEATDQVKFDNGNFTANAIKIENSATYEHVISNTDIPNKSSAGFYGFLRSNLRYLVIFWFIGVLLLSIRMLAQYVYAERYKYLHKKLVKGKTLKSFESLQEKLRISKNIQLFESSIARVPLVVGVFKPVVIVPLSALSGLNEDMLEHILAHELAHIKRHDYLWNLIQTVIETLFFYHPFVWWISHEIRKERENACDDIAIDVCGSAALYAEALLGLEQTRHKPNVALAATSNLKERVMRILNIKQNKQNKQNSLFVGLLLLIILSGFMLSQAFSQADDSTKTQNITASSNDSSLEGYHFYWVSLNKYAKFDDDYNLLELPEGGYLTVEEGLANPTRKLTISNINNRFKYEYSEDQKHHDFDNEAQIWFRRAISENLKLPFFENHTIDASLGGLRASDSNVVVSWPQLVKNTDSSKQYGHTYIESNKHVGAYSGLSPRTRYLAEGDMLNKLSNAFHSYIYSGKGDRRFASAIQELLFAWELTPRAKAMLKLIIKRMKDDNQKLKLLQEIDNKEDAEMVSSNYFVFGMRRDLPFNDGFFVSVFGGYKFDLQNKSIEPLNDGDVIMIEEPLSRLGKKLIVYKNNGKLVRRYFENYTEVALPTNIDNWLDVALQGLVTIFNQHESKSDGEIVAKPVSKLDTIKSEFDYSQKHYFLELRSIPLDFVYGNYGRNYGPYEINSSADAQGLLSDGKDELISLIHEYILLRPRLNVDEARPFVRRHLLEAASFVQMNSSNVSKLLMLLNRVEDDDLVADVLMVMAPRMVDLDNELKMELDVLVETIKDQKLKDEIRSGFVER